MSKYKEANKEKYQRNISLLIICKDININNNIIATMFWRYILNTGSDGTV